MRQDGFSPVKICSSSTAVALARAGGGRFRSCPPRNDKRGRHFPMHGCVDVCMCGACETGHVTCCGRICGLSPFFAPIGAKNAGAETCDNRHVACWASLVLPFFPFFAGASRSGTRPAAAAGVQHRRAGGALSCCMRRLFTSFFGVPPVDASRLASRPAQGLLIE